MSANHTRVLTRRVTTLRGQMVQEESWPMILTKGQTTLILKNSACFFKKEMGWITNQCFNNWWVMFNYCTGMLPLKGRTLLPKKDSVTSETSDFIPFLFFFSVFTFAFSYVCGRDNSRVRGADELLLCNLLEKSVSALSREDRNVDLSLLKDALEKMFTYSNPIYYWYSHI